MPLPDDHDRALQTVALKVQDAAWDRRWRYFQGKHDRIWATPKMAETFRELADSFTENYCSVAINARVSRLEVTGWDGDTRAETVWEQGAFPQRQDVLYRWGLTYGVVYLVVQDDQIAANSPVLCYAQPDPNDWMKQAWAGKMWLDIDSGEWHASLWDETDIYRYKATGQVPYTPAETLTMYSPQGMGWVFQDAQRHGYDQVPVVPCQPYGFQAAPLLDQVKPIQDKINKLSANKFVAAEFGAFKQRVFFTRQQLDPFDVRQQPDTAIVLDPGDSDARASVQELGQTDLTVFDHAKDKEIDAFFTIAALPRHLRQNMPGHVSGEALKADESPFLEALHDHQREFGEGMVEAMRIMGIEATPAWRDTSPRDEFRNAQTLDLLVRSGLPWQTAAQMYMGFSSEEIADAEAELEAAQGAAQDEMNMQTSAFLTNPLMG